MLEYYADNDAIADQPAILKVRITQCNDFHRNSNHRKGHSSTFGRHFSREERSRAHLMSIIVSVCF